MNSNDRNFANASPNGNRTPLGIQGQTNVASNSTIINMDRNSPTPSSQRRSMQSNLLNLFNGARFQLARQTSYPDTTMHIRNTLGSGGLSGSISELLETQPPPRQTENVNSLSFTSPQNNRLRNTRTWRMNLNDVLAFSSTPSTLHSLISHSSGLRYTPLSTGSNIGSDNPPDITTELRLNTRLGRSQSMQPNEQINNSPQLHHSNSISNAILGFSSTVDTPLVNPERDIPNEPNHQSDSVIHMQDPNNHYNHQAGQTGIDQDYNVLSGMLVTLLSHVFRYLPFICILLLKFIFDQILGIMDVLLLHVIMRQMNKSLRDQVTKLSQKNYGVLLRNLAFIIVIVSYRILLNGMNPDPYGMLINPVQDRTEINTINNGITTEDTVVSELTSVTNSNHITFGILIYYVIVNDLILKLITILIKIIVALMPTKTIKYKSRARTYVVVEYLSQTYRALSPIHQYVLYIAVSPPGLDVFSRILFASLYIIAKGFEIYVRGKYLQKALLNLIKNMDYERSPTKDELDAVDNTCPICHDSFNNPTIMECSHIFCDDCISTWFKREQTCPMCRTKISEDPTWQDGSTSFFYQLC